MAVYTAGQPLKRVMVGTGATAVAASRIVVGTGTSAVEVWSAVQFQEQGATRGPLGSFAGGRQKITGWTAKANSVIAADDLVAQGAAPTARVRVLSVNSTNSATNLYIHLNGAQVAAGTAASPPEYVGPLVAGDRIHVEGQWFAGGSVPNGLDLSATLMP